MKRNLLVVLGLILSASPTHAADNASLRLVAYVPISCSLDVVDASLSGSQLTMFVRRSCNTGHRLVIDGEYNPALGSITYRYNENIYATTNGTGIIAQPEAYYEDVDELVIESSDGNADDLLRYARSLTVGLETT